LISIADIFTCINGLLGLFSILATVSGWYFFAINLILLGVLADGLDGVFARRFSKRWYLGDYLDIMCDSFGAILQDMNKAPVMIPLACGAILVAGVLRLARFCYQSPFMKGDHFIGVPTPSAASTLTLFMLLDLDLGNGKPGTLYPVTVSVLAFALAFLMISDIKIIKMKGNLEWFAGGLVILAIVLNESPEVVAMVLLASVVYIVGGPLAIRRIEKKNQGLAVNGTPPKKHKKAHKEKPKEDSEE
jgi:phosphatidylserine synthase